MHDRSLQVRIRDAVPTEFDLISALMMRANDQYSDMATNPAWRSYLEDAADVAGHAVTLTVIVAERSGSLVGSVGYSAPHAAPGGKQSLPAAWAVIRSLAVDPSARGSGIGRALALECLARARRDGAATVGLTTHERMSVAKSMYEGMGFVRAPSYDYFSDEEVHVIAYRLDLSLTVGE
jgi:ribosomal protein S18 acetylase RimI-like enzyme